MRVGSVVWNLGIGLLALAGLALAWFFWAYGGGTILVVTNVGREPVVGASILLLDEGGDRVRDGWVTRTVSLAPGESVEVELEGHDANPGIRLTAADGSATTVRIQAYVGGIPQEIRADVAKGAVVRALSKRRRGATYEPAGLIPVPRPLR